MLKYFSSSLLVLVFLSSCLANATANCEDHLEPQVVEEMNSPVDQVYQILTSVSSWGGKIIPNFFLERETPSKIYCSCEQYLTLIEFIHQKLGDPKSFRDFLNETIVTKDWMISELQKIGFQIENSKTLVPRDFYKLIARGVIVLEQDPHLLENGHGHLTHLLQLVYVSKYIDSRFGEGTMLKFYKFIGASDYWIWAELFDSPNRTDLGNPLVITRILPILGLR